MSYTYYISEESGGTWFSIENARLVRVDREGERLLNEGRDLFDDELADHQEQCVLSDFIRKLSKTSSKSSD